jgi:hypothetical protein
MIGCVKFYDQTERAENLLSPISVLRVSCILDPFQAWLRISIFTVHILQNGIITVTAGN